MAEQCDPSLTILGHLKQPVTQSRSAVAACMPQGIAGWQQPHAEINCKPRFPVNTSAQSMFINNSQQSVKQPETYQIYQPNAHCNGAKVMVFCKPSNHGNQQCLYLRVGHDVGVWGFLTFDLAQHASRAAIFAIRLLQ